MKKISMETEHQMCRSIGIADLGKIDGNIALGEQVVMDYPGSEPVPGRCVRVDEDTNRAFIQNLGMYGWTPKNVS